MSLIILGYIFGIIHKLLYSRDIVIWLYVFNALLVSFDLFLYFLYIKRNREQLKQNQNQLGPTLIFILRKFFGVILLAIAVNMFVNNISVIIAQVK